MLIQDNATMANVVDGTEVSLAYAILEILIHDIGEIQSMPKLPVISVIQSNIINKAAMTIPMLLFRK